MKTDSSSLKKVSYLFRLGLCLLSFLSIQCSPITLRPSSLPKQTPADFEISYYYHKSGGEITLNGNELKCSNRDDRKVRNGAVKITDEEKDAIYQEFVKNKFDLLNKLPSKFDEVLPYEDPKFNPLNLSLKVGSQFYHSIGDSVGYFDKIETEFSKLISKYSDGCK